MDSEPRVCQRDQNRNDNGTLVGIFNFVFSSVWELSVWFEIRQVFYFALFYRDFEFEFRKFKGKEHDF